MAHYAVEIDNVTKRFKGVQALNGLSLKVERGTTYGLLGPNGAGKTTLIRILVGLLQADSGKVTVLDSVMPTRAIQNRLGYMTQSPALYDELTVQQNVEFFAAVQGVHDRSEIQNALELVELQARASSPVRTLSGGMKQRCSLACALVNHPDLLVLDEPTVGVDPQLRAQFWAYFQELNHQGVTLIVSSHVMDEAERCAKLGFVRAGKLLAEGTPAQLRQGAGAASLEEAFLTFANQSALTQ